MNAPPNTQHHTFSSLFSLPETFPPPLHNLPIIAVPTELDPNIDTLETHPYLSPTEQSTPTSWRSNVRRKHWFAGRAAAKIAVHSVYPDLSRYSDLHVEHHPLGAPFIQHPDGYPIDLSITHSGSWALACVIPQGYLLGIDYEIGADERVHLARKVCSPSQRALHGLHPEDNRQETPLRFGSIWTAKEAFLKAFAVGLVAKLDHIVVSVPNERGHLTVSTSSSIHDLIPHPLPEPAWAGTTCFEDHPISFYTLQT